MAETQRQIIYLVPYNFLCKINIIVLQMADDADDSDSAPPVTEAEQRDHILDNAAELASATNSWRLIIENGDGSPTDLHAVDIEELKSIKNELQKAKQETMPKWQMFLVKHKATTSVWLTTEQFNAFFSGKGQYPNHEEINKLRDQIPEGGEEEPAPDGGTAYTAMASMDTLRSFGNVQALRERVREVKRVIGTRERAPHHSHDDGPRMRNRDIPTVDDWDPGSRNGRTPREHFSAIKDRVQTLAGLTPGTQKFTDLVNYVARKHLSEKTKDAVMAQEKQWRVTNNLGEQDVGGEDELIKWMTSMLTETESVFSLRTKLAECKMFTCNLQALNAFTNEFLKIQNTMHERGVEHGISQLKSLYFGGLHEGLSKQSTLAEFREDLKLLNDSLSFPEYIGEIKTEAIRVLPATSTKDRVVQKSTDGGRRKKGPKGRVNAVQGRKPDNNRKNQSTPNKKKGDKDSRQKKKDARLKRIVAAQMATERDRERGPKPKLCDICGLTHPGQCFHDPKGFKGTLPPWCTVKKGADLTEFRKTNLRKSR